MYFARAENTTRRQAHRPPEGQKFKPGGIAYDRFATGMTAADLILGQLRPDGKAPSSTAVTGEYIEGDSIRPLKKAAVP